MFKSRKGRPHGIRTRGGAAGIGRAEVQQQPTETKKDDEAGSESESDLDMPSALIDEQECPGPPSARQIKTRRPYLAPMVPPDVARTSGPQYATHYPDPYNFNLDELNCFLNEPVNVLKGIRSYAKFNIIKRVENYSHRKKKLQWVKLQNMMKTLTDAELYNINEQLAIDCKERRRCKICKIRLKCQHHFDFHKATMHEMRYVSDVDVKVRCSVCKRSFYHSSLREHMKRHDYEMRKVYCYVLKPEHPPNI